MLIEFESFVVINKKKKKKKKKSEGKGWVGKPLNLQK